MSLFYPNLSSVASTLLKSRGALLTFSRETSSVHDPASGKNTTTTSTYTGYGAAFAYNQSEINGNTIKNGDINLLLEAVTTEPAQGDSVTIDSITYRMMAIKKTSPAGTPVIYEIQLRR